MSKLFKIEIFENVFLFSLTLSGLLLLSLRKQLLSYKVRHSLSISAYIALNIMHIFSLHNTRN